MTVLGDKASARVKSAAEPFIRPVSSGAQDYDTQSKEYPLTQPMTKLAAKLQVIRKKVFVAEILACEIQISVWCVVLCPTIHPILPLALQPTHHPAHWPTHHATLQPTCHPALQPTLLPSRHPFLDPPSFPPYYSVFICYVEKGKRKL